MKYQNFLIELPKEYNINELEDGSLAIENVLNGVGAITITRYEIPSYYEFIIKNELNDFLHSIDGYSSELECFTKKISHTQWSTEFTSLENRFWKVWVFYKHGLGFFITYNCDMADKKNELFNVEKIINSIEISPI